jgi:poly-gamma-glutamate capsule biosynthesis protein CapA/YwtB (metallophosphatase superfamily)
LFQSTANGKVRNIRHFFLEASVYLILSISAVFFIVILSGTKPSEQLTSIFNSSSPKTFPDRPVHILFAGDVMLGRSVLTRAREANDFGYPFEKVKNILTEADISFINLENPIVDKCPPHDSGFIFCTDPQMLIGMRSSGIDIVTLANNHSANYGKDGLRETKEYLTQNGILYTGVGELVTITKADTTFGFLGFDKSQQSKPQLTHEERDLISSSAGSVDVLIIGMHWGVEYQNKALEGQRSLAREFVSLGADAVVGHHPHWLQDYETIDGVPVYYSLGNFVFDQMWSEETKKGMVVELVFDGKNLVGEKQYRTYMKSVGQPEFVDN